MCSILLASVEMDGWGGSGLPIFSVGGVSICGCTPSYGLKVMTKPESLGLIIHLFQLTKDWS